MGDLIDKNNLYAEAECLYKSTTVGMMSFKKAFRKLFNAIAEAPIIEAESIVRCSNCKYFHQLSQNRGKCEKSISPIAFPYTNSFCSFGEKKEEEATS